MYEFMCVIWQLVGSLAGLLVLAGLVNAVVAQFRSKEEVEDDD